MLSTGCRLLLLLSVANLHSVTFQSSVAYSGICCITSPCSSFPFACLLRLMPSLPHVPHCLKKNAAHCCSTCCLMFSTHSGFIGRANGPLSPPTIIQSMPLRFSSPKSSISGSHERNFTFAPNSLRSSIRFFELGHSTVTPNQTFCGISLALKYSPIRLERLVRIWYRCCGVWLIVFMIRSTNSNGTFS